MTQEELEFRRRCPYDAFGDYAQSLFLLCPVRRAMTVDHASELLLLQVPAYDCAVISNDFGTNNLKRGDAYDLIVSDRRKPVNR